MFSWFTNLWSSLFKRKPTTTVPATTTTVTTEGKKMRKKALFVGINYVGTQNQLNGCINDVILVNQIVRDFFGFGKDDSTNVRMLTEESATTANIKERLKWLVDGAQSGDVLLLDYSMHGVQMACPNYEEHKEADGLDECICPIDFDWRNNVIRDNDMIEIFKNLPAGVNLTVISDSCHSGDLLREVVNPMIQPSASPNKARTMPIPPDIRNRAYGMQNRQTMREIRNINNEQVGILISGCKSTQTSADAWIQKVGKYHGALTYYLTEILKENKYNITYADLVAQINKRLAADGYTQNPQLDCAEGLQNKKFLQPLI